jgi:hypothetical protein
MWLMVNDQRRRELQSLQTTVFSLALEDLTSIKKRTRGFSSTVWKNERTIITISALTADSLNSLLNKTQKVNYIVMLYFFHKESKQLLPA